MVGCGMGLRSAVYAFQHGSLVRSERRGVLLLALVLASAAWLVLSTRKRASPCRRWRGNACPVVLLAGLLTLLMTMFPPVTQPRREPPRPINAAALPKFAFIFDRRFDFIRHVREFAVDGSTLLREWLVTTGLAVAVCCVIAAKRRKLQHILVKDENT